MKKRRGRPLIVGLTGGIASGKSTVVKEFRRLGASIIDADEISRSVVVPGKPAWKRILGEFGRPVINEDRTLNRKALAQLVFSDSRKRKLLERLTHPAIIAQIKRTARILLKRSSTKLVLVDAPLLFEAGLERSMDRTIVVWTPKRMQRERLKKRDRLTSREIEARLAAQWPLGRKRSMADFVVDNSRSLAHTRSQIKNILGLLTIKSES